MRVLIVEDNLELVNLLTKGLKSATFQVDHVSTLEDCRYKTEVNEYDCLILDVNLPDGNGLDFLAGFRQKDNKTPVLILTVHSEVTDKVEGLNRGADDYLVKPFSIDELIARVKALTRRNMDEKRPVLNCGKLKLDQVSFEATYNEEKLDLVKKEFMLLEYLMLNKKKIVTRPQIWEHVWGLDDYPLNNTVDVHVASLRKKMKEICGEDIIKTVRGLGYKIECEEKL